MTTGRAARGVTSILFCPADDDAKLRKLPARGLPAVALDLEDAVSPQHRAAARRLVIEHSAAIGADSLVYVRVNDSRSADHGADVESVIESTAHGVILPKVESAEELTEFIGTLDRHPRGREMRVIAMIETAVGLRDAGDIARAASGRIDTLMLGTADLCADLGLTPGPDERELDFARGVTVTAARAAGLAGPVDGPRLDLAMAGFREACQRSRRQGFAGRVCLTPGQAIAAVEEYGGISDADRAAAQSIVEAFEAAETKGLSVATAGEIFVDRPVYLQARDLLDRSRTTPPRDA